MGRSGKKLLQKRKIMEDKLQEEAKSDTTEHFKESR